MLLMTLFIRLCILHKSFIDVNKMTSITLNVVLSKFNLN
uniref:Uncharacterized protein n=1 Tax=Gredgaria maugeana TaxID=2007213 RepID=A0A1Z1MM54_9FLOR|nr:hypothetical protein [Gredgaria maugeana]ARW67170.1 hypothetical protein [Gredgaria maugeana]